MGNCSESNLFPPLRSFGVCCVFIINSATSTTVSQNCTYLQNPSFPGTDTANAPTYTVQKCSNGTMKHTI